MASIKSTDDENPLASECRRITLDGDYEDTVDLEFTAHNDPKSRAPLHAYIYTHISVFRMDGTWVNEQDNFISH